MSFEQPILDFIQELIGGVDFDTQVSEKTDVPDPEEPDFKGNRIMTLEEQRLYNGFMEMSCEGLQQKMFKIRDEIIFARTIGVSDAENQLLEIAQVMVWAWNDKVASGECKV